MKYSLIGIFIFVLCTGILSAQTFMPSDTGRIIARYLPPIDEEPLIYEIGAGFGVPYGLFGMKGSLGTAQLTGDVGLGIIPLGWDVSAAVGGSWHILDRYSAINPRLTVLLTNTAGYNLLLKDNGSVGGDVYYKESFPGYAIFGGVDFRLGSSSQFFISVNIGAVSTFIGNDEAERRYNIQKAKLEHEGYVIESESVNYNVFPKFSLGVSYIIGRNLELRF